VTTVKAILSTLVALAFAAAVPAVAAEDCHARQAPIDKTFGERFDKQATNVRAIAREALALCKAGKNEESLKRYDDAIRVTQQQPVKK
jgi:hypothetical protein